MAPFFFLPLQQAYFLLVCFFKTLWSEKLLCEKTLLVGRKNTTYKTNEQNSYFTGVTIPFSGACHHDNKVINAIAMK